MEKPNVINYRQMIFGTLFVLPNKLQKLMDRGLCQYDVTSKQWFLTSVIEYLFKSPPTLNELAKTMGYSHQNVKQVALKLEGKGFLRMDKDKKDQRALRLRLTEKSYKFWEALHGESEQFMDGMYEGLSGEELAMLSKALQKITTNLEKMEMDNPEEEET
ncbi:MAG: winged helix DNA-binding protein [Clostridia bacterium]|nr:winged helix DNA-binding protein [Clostridia bacterium]